MASSSSAIIWGKLSYRKPNSNGLSEEEITLESADVMGSRYIIGRAKDCNLQIGLKMISAHHCYLDKENGKVFLYDTSTNGTFVNSNKVGNGSRKEVSHGDKLYLIRKKNHPESEFHLVFTINEPTGNNGPATGLQESSDTSIRKTKRLKVDSDVSSQNTAPVVKTEPTDSYEELAQPVTEENIVKEEKVDDPTADPDVTGVPEQENEESRPNKQAKSNNTPSSSTEDNGMEDALKCSLCLEILHDPVCLQPCMHCYCAGCYSEWMSCSNDCPQCRATVQLLAKNHMISSLVEAFLKSNPDKKRPQCDIDRLNEQNTITRAMLQRGNKQCPVNCQCNECAADSSSGEDNDDSQICYPVYNLSICKQCPRNNNPNTDPNPGCSSSNDHPAPFVCNPLQTVHMNCTCCCKPMPDRRNELNVKPQRCSLCLGIYCHLYWGCSKPGCLGCINKFVDLVYSADNMSKLINDNVVETRILTDYIQSQGKSTQDVIRECLVNLDAGSYSLPVVLRSDSVLCISCGLTNLKKLVYNYRKDLPSNVLPAAVASRPNCYWGLNCRTQKHNMNHAQKYNHICNQTRF